ncbi:hypothetical protein KUTeg_023923, partial [Tegillarca granosa]
MEKKKSSAKTKLSRNKKKAETKINILTITGDLNETCEFKKPEKILSKSSTVKSLTLKKSEEKIIPSRSNEKISRQNLITEPECETENSKCPACLLVIQGNLQCHLQTCLKRKFGRNGAPKKEVTSSSTGNSNELDTEPQNEDRVLKVGHINKDGNEENQKELSQDVDSPLDPDVDFCHICQKDISRLNSQRKLQHVNKCIDEGEEKQRAQEEEKKALESAKTAVLSCPMCGKPFKTDTGRKNHLKKCALSLGVKTEQMLKLVKEQEEEHQLKLAAGILPLNPRKLTKSASGTSGVSIKRGIKEPKNKLDEDTQIAMAISSSLTEEQNKPERTVINKLGVSSVDKVEGDTRKGKKKKKKGQDVQPVLLMLPDDEKQKRMENKVMSVLIPQDEDEEIENTPPSLQKSVLQEKYQADLNEAPGFWQKSQLQEIIIDKLNNKEMFYVQTLMPPVEESNVIAGSKVRRMSEIPGRRKSARVHYATQNKTNTTGTADETQSSDVMMVSTQTAVVLAELASVGGEQDDDIESPGCSGFCPEKYINIQEKTQNQLAKELKNSFLKLLENPVGSDLEIISLDGRHDVHRTIIICRCPELSKMAEGSLVHLEEFSSDVVSSILMYIYAGEITLTPAMLESVLKLAERLKLNELVEVYEQIKSQVSMETGDQDTEDIEVSNNHVNRRTSEIDSLLKEIMDDSDEDMETKSDSLDTETDQFHSNMDDFTTKKDREEEIDGHISDGDYYDIMCSQRKKLQKITKDNVEENTVEGICDNFDEKECIDLVGEDHKKHYQANQEIDYVNKEKHVIETNNICVENKNDICTIDNKDNRIETHGSGDNSSFNEIKSVKDKIEIEKMNMNTSQKSTKTNKNEKVKSQKARKVKTRQECVSPDVFSDVKDTSLVYDNEELVIFNQSESNDSFKHSADQDMDELSKHSGDIDDKNFDDSGLDQKVSYDYKNKNININLIKSKRKSSGENNEAEKDNCNKYHEEDDENLSSSISLSDHAVIICSDDSSDSITDKPVGKQTNNYHGNRNILESTRIYPSFSVIGENTNKIDEISIIKSQQSNKTVKTSQPSNTHRSPKARNFSQGSSLNESVDHILNRRLNSSSNDLFASPPEHEAKSRNSKSVMKSNNSMCQISPKNYENDNSSELVSGNTSTNSSFQCDFLSEKSGSGFSENMLDKRKGDNVRKELSSSEDNSVAFPVEEEKRITEDGLALDKSERSISEISYKKKISDEGFPRLSLSQKSHDDSVKHKKRKHMDARTSSDENSDSQIRSLSFKKTKLDNNSSVADDAAGFFSDSSSGASTSISRNGSPDKNISSHRNKVNKQKAHGMVMSEIDTLNSMNEKEPSQIGDDVEIVSDNFTELSQRRSLEQSQTKSPIFKVKEKKKFLFKKRKQLSNIQTLEEEKECIVAEDNQMKINDKHVDLSHSDEQVDGDELNSGCQPGDDMVDDVWEGFDDCGGGVMFDGGDCEIETPVTCDMESTVPHTTSTASQSNRELDKTKDKNRDLDEDREKSFEKCLDIVQDDESDKHVEEADLPEIGNDSFMWRDDNAPFENVDNFTVETVEEGCKNLKSSKKSKDDFKTPSVTRSRNETDSDYEDDDQIQTNKDDLLHIKKVQNNTTKSKSGVGSSTGVKSTSSSRKATVTQPEVVAEDESLSSSDETNCSQESVQSYMVEESFLHVPFDDEDIPQSQMTTGMELRQKFLDFIHSRPDIKVRILMYEPLELDWLKKEIKESGIKCSMDKVMEFLDEK